MYNFYKNPRITQNFEKIDSQLRERLCKVGFTLNCGNDVMIGWVEGPGFKPRVGSPSMNSMKLDIPLHFIS